MAYTVGWDESAPLGSAAANTIDTEFQNLKLSIRERLEDTFPQWGNDSVDPKKVHVHSGTAANRPTTSLSTGQVYFATDTKTISVYSGSAWVEATGQGVLKVGDTSSRPAANDVAAPLFYYDNEAFVLYINDGTQWLSSGGAAGGGGVGTIVTDTEIGVQSIGASATVAWTVDVGDVRNAAEWQLIGVMVRFTPNTGYEIDDANVIAHYCNTADDLNNLVAAETNDSGATNELFYYYVELIYGTVNTVGAPDNVQYKVKIRAENQEASVRNFNYEIRMTWIRIQVPDA